MTYELAKRLKELGFPQEYKSTNRKMYGKLAYIFGVKGLRIRPRPTIRQVNQMEFVGLDVVVLPTLSELIESCGNGKSLVIMGPYTVDVGECYWGPGEGWHAYYQGHRAMDFPEGTGSTIEEAVANLWLKLNKKLSTV